MKNSRCVKCSRVVTGNRYAGLFCEECRESMKFRPHQKNSSKFSGTIGKRFAKDRALARRIRGELRSKHALRRCLTQEIVQKGKLQRTNSQHFSPDGLTSTTMSFPVRNFVHGIYEKDKYDDALNIAVFSLEASENFSRGFWSKMSQEYHCVQPSSTSLDRTVVGYIGDTNYKCLTANFSIPSVGGNKESVDGRHHYVSLPSSGAQKHTNFMQAFSFNRDDSYAVTQANALNLVHLNLEALRNENTDHPSFQLDILLKSKIAGRKMALNSSPSSSSSSSSSCSPNAVASSVSSPIICPLCGKPAFMLIDGKCSNCH